MGEAVSSAASVLSSGMSFITGDSYLKVLIGIFVLLGVVGGLVALFRR